MKLSWKSELAMWVLIAGMFALAAFSWSWAPDRIPVHWNLHEQVDRHGGKFEGLFGIPLMTIAIYLLMTFLPRIDPGRVNYPGFWGAFTTLRVALVVFMAAIYGVMHLWLHGIHTRMNTVMPFLVGALFVVVGNVLGKVQPNWFVGIRTPWTLSSREAWVRAHRAGSWVFIVTGLIFMAAGVLEPHWVMWTAIGVLLVGMLGVAVYSYFVWRADPDKAPPPGASRA